MQNHPRHNYSNTVLDPDLASTHFRLQTHWHVITGASCSGKTTVINMLAAKGFQTVPESARQYFETEVAKGRTIEEIRRDRVDLTYRIGGLQKQIECGLNANESLFLDRALPDTLVFYRIAGLNPNELLPDCFHHRYASVFMLDRLPYLRDGIRSADDATANYYDAWIERDYQALGYRVVRVPVLPPDERLTFILGELASYVNS